MVDLDRDAEKGAAKTVTVIGFGHRVAAFLVDIMVVWFLGIFLGMALSVVLLILTMYGPDESPPLDWFILLFGLIVSVAYFVVPWARSGQTLGKMAVGIKVVGADGNPPSGGKALLRYVGYLVSGLVLSLGFLWVAFDRKRQGWHDKIAGTYVVYSDTVFSDVDAVELVPADPRPGWVWIGLWIFLLFSMPVALVSTVSGLGPYMAQLLVTIFSGGG